MILLLLKLVWWDSSIKLCNWFLIDSWDLVLDCFCVSKVILILCKDTCMFPEQSLKIDLINQLDILNVVFALVLLWIL